MNEAFYVTAGGNHMNEACYVMQFVAPLPFEETFPLPEYPLYLRLEWWCGGLERWKQVADIHQASRFTAEAARRRCQSMWLAADGIYDAAFDEETAILPGVLEPVYVPAYDPRQMKIEEVMLTTTK